MSTTCTLTSPASAASINASLGGWGVGASFYDMLVNETAPSLIVEVGVWKGRSAVYLADAMRRRVGGGALIAVDTWLGALEFWTRSLTAGAPDPTRGLAFKNGFPQVYFHFLANVVQAGLAPYVLPFPATSRLAISLLRSEGVLADLIHIDAGHSYLDAKEDIALWWPLVRPGGVMLGDDFRPSWSGVVRAACEHAAEHGPEGF
jgi:hypothetical protein|eukprot:6857230-Prymnesium_polylepis.2